MTDKFAYLRAALAAGPTPGPWFHGAKNGDHKYCVYDKICWTDESGRHGETPNMVVHVSPDDGRYREAAYIAAANPETISKLLAERDELARERDELKREAVILREAILAVEDLIQHSHGVAGLHQNGDIAPWSELLAGGRFEGWLCAFSAAVDRR